MTETLTYISGPYSSDPERNTEIAMDVADRLEDAGVGIVAVIPHLSHFRHARKPRDYRHWMFVDKALLKRCHVMIRIPGDSPGAEEEHELANERQIPVFHSEAEVIAFAREVP